MMRDALILFAITLVAGLALGFTNELTKEARQKQQELAIRQACQAVFAEAEAFVHIDQVPGVEFASQWRGLGVQIGTAYDAIGADGTHLGYVVETTTGEGYGGDITIYVGVTDTGKLNGISILEIAETPGLGMKAEEVLVPQFAGKTAELFTYTKTGSSSPNEIDAISGATVTTQAMVNAVNGGIAYVTEELRLQEGGTEDE